MGSSESKSQQVLEDKLQHLSGSQLLSMYLQNQTYSNPNISSRISQESNKKISASQLQKQDENIEEFIKVWIVPDKNVFVIGDEPVSGKVMVYCQQPITCVDGGYIQITLEGKESFKYF